MSLLTNVLKLWRTGQYLLPADSGFSPKHLFAGRVGWWLDPLDFRYARQDSAGATAYTAVEQGVGMAVDKSANGLTFVQASGPAKPVVSARVNLLLKTYAFDFFSATGVTPGTPAGGVIEITENSSNALHQFQYFMDIDTSRKRIQISAKCGVGNRNLHIQLNNGFNRGYATFDLVNGVVLSNTTSGSGLATAGISADSDGFWKCWAECTTDAGFYRTHGFGPALGNAATYSGDGVSSIVIRNPSYVSASKVNLPYQRVNTYTDYDTAGFPNYLKFDGVATNLVGASGGGASTAFYFGAAVQFGKVGAVQTIVSDAGTNTGFKIRTTAANQIEISAGNGAAFTAVNTAETFAAGDVAFIELFDNGTNLSACLGNGTPATVARPAVSAGTAQMTLGKANNAASEYSGVSIFSAVYLKDYCPTAAERADYKRWALQRAGVAS